MSIAAQADWSEPGEDAGPGLASARLAHMFDLKRLVMLREVARGGSFAAAASQLSFTPSAVSQQMAALERDTRAVLFERTHAGMQLSEAGRALLVHSEGVLCRLADAHDELQARAEGRVGRLRFGSFPSATTAFAADALELFRRRSPGVDVLYIDGEPYESVPMLRAREVDIAVLFLFDGWSPAHDYQGRLLGSDAGLDYVHLFDDPYRLVMPRGHRLAATDTLALAALEGVPLVGSAEPCAAWGWGPGFRLACQDRGFDPAFQPFYRTADFSSVQALVATGRALALIPASALAPLRPDLVAVPLEAAPVRRVKAATPAEASSSPCRAEMLRALFESTAALRSGG